MKAVVFTHPNFLDSTSMPLFAQFVTDGLTRHGIEFRTLSPAPWFHRLPAPARFKKWLGYMDQYIVFPVVARWKTRRDADDTVYIFTDQALGPWVPGFASRPHVIHCHDFLALKSALGEIPQNPVSWTGRQYQRLIRRGFSRGRHFACISHQTRDDLLRFHRAPGEINAQVILNGLNYPFSPMPEEVARKVLSETTGINVPARFIMHVGGNQWYKHRDGVLEIYDAYAARTEHPVPLLMVGAPPEARMEAMAEEARQHGGTIDFLIRPSVRVIHALYSLADALVFPSIAEGFGWPIAEAMACGCPVLTTGAAPMNEVGGAAAFYLPEKTAQNQATWAAACAEKLGWLLNRPEHAKQITREHGFAQARLFEPEPVVLRYLALYQQVAAEARAAGDAATHAPVHSAPSGSSS